MITRRATSDTSKMSGINCCKRNSISVNIVLVLLSPLSPFLRRILNYDSKGLREERKKVRPHVDKGAATSANELKLNFYAMSCPKCAEVIASASRSPWDLDQGAQLENQGGCLYCLTKGVLS